MVQEAILDGNSAVESFAVVPTEWSLVYSQYEDLPADYVMTSWSNAHQQYLPHTALPWD